MKNLKAVFVGLILIAVNLQAAPAAKTIEVLVKATTKQSKVEFEAIGKPSMLKIKGQGDGTTADLKLNGNVVNGEFYFNLASLKTGIDMRDSHMKEKYLHTDKHPQAVLQIKDLKLPDSWSMKNAVLKDKDFTGTMTLHGEKKEISGKFSIASNKLDGLAEFEIKLSDFKIDIPAYLGVKVADVVKVKVHFNEMTELQK